MKKLAYSFLSFLLILSSSYVFASENVIGWSILPMNNFPSVTQIGNAYGVTYTIYNNHPVASIPISTSITANGNFTVNNTCLGLVLGPKGSPNSSCTIDIGYTPLSPGRVSLQVTLNYGRNRVALPGLSTNSLIQGVNGGRLIGYLPGYLPPASPVDLFNAGYTDILVAFGVFSTTNPGQIVSAFSTVTPELIKQMKQLGMRVLLSIGGASSDIPNTTANYNQVLTAAPSPAAFQTTFLASLAELVQKYGFDGFDFDVEEGFGPGPGGTMSNPGGAIASLGGIINAARTMHPDWLLTLAPQIANVACNAAFNSTFANYSSLVMLTYQSLTWVGVQVYNAGTFYAVDNNIYDPKDASSPNASVALSNVLTVNWPQGAPNLFQPYIANLLPSQVVLGYLVPNSLGQVDGGLPVIPTTTIKRAVQCLRTGVASSTSCASYIPAQSTLGIAGVFGWQTNYDQNNNFAFAKSLKPCVVDGICS